MVYSLERIPIAGVCKKCGSDGVDAVYAQVGFDMWYDCVHCGELQPEDVLLDKKSDLNSFIRVVLSEGGEDGS
jgi:uncharacterized Zn finger protein